MRAQNYSIQVETDRPIAVMDLTGQVQDIVTSCGIRNGVVVVTTRHTTTGIVINEAEPRLLEDMRTFLERLAPRGAGYLHDDIHLRDCPPDEPKNAHSHLAALLVGSSEAITLAGGILSLGQWQSVMLIELDGPRQRTVGVQIMGE